MKKIPQELAVLEGHFEDRLGECTLSNSALGRSPPKTGILCKTVVTRIWNVYGRAGDITCAAAAAHEVAAGPKDAKLRPGKGAESAEFRDSREIGHVEVRNTKARTECLNQD